MKKFFLYLIFLFLFNSTSNAFFGKLKLECTSRTTQISVGKEEEYVRSFEMIEKGDILIINLPGEVILNKTKDDDISLVGEIKGSISEVRFKVLKNSLLYSFTRTWKKDNPWTRIEKGKCKKL